MVEQINLIPMAGAGQRFLDAGYTTAKPLIPVDGEPMIAHAAGCLPAADRWIFVCRQEHIDDYAIDRELKTMFDPADVISVAALTEGQACTCLLARDMIPADACVTIGACDNAMTYDRNAYQSVMEEPGVDAIIWTFRQNPAVLQDPRMYGWVSVGADDTVTGVSVKIPISDTPMNDHAVIGAFTFRRWADFVRCSDTMIEADRRIRNEFYVDEAMNLAVELGLRVKVFEVDRYICWGTPQDLDTYNYWAGYFRKTRNV
ncbi:MAG: NTP transferase domain-containing protein [Verrucomicrobia bacterium]|nr:NTP transferase domain-containing protein [Verrucomicrobiota bacterium]